MVQNSKKKCVLIASGLDPGGGAGLIADCAAVRAANCAASGVPTVLTVQDGKRFISAVDTDPAYIHAALTAVFEAGRVEAVKIGALKSASVANAVAQVLEEQHPKNVVIDPVMRSTSGGILLDADGVAVLKAKLFAKATLVTPNLAEASALSGMSVKSVEDMKIAAAHIQHFGPKAVLVKGGHLEGNAAVDVLLCQTGLHLLKAERKLEVEVRGTGCALSSLVAAWLAQGLSVLEAANRSREMLGRALHNAYDAGGGVMHLGDF